MISQDFFVAAAQGWARQSRMGGGASVGLTLEPWCQNGSHDPENGRGTGAKQKKNRGCVEISGTGTGLGAAGAEEWTGAKNGAQRWRSIPGGEEGVSISPTPVFLRLGHQWPGGYAG